jgi:hypothetical protein
MDGVTAAETFTYKRKSKHHLSKDDTCVSGKRTWHSNKRATRETGSTQT